MDVRKALEVLRLEPTASLDDIRRAYRDLVKVWSPDRFANDAHLQAKAEGAIREADEAFDVLMDSRATTTSPPVGSSAIPPCDTVSSPGDTHLMSLAASGPVHPAKTLEQIPNKVSARRSRWFDVAFWAIMAYVICGMFGMFAYFNAALIGTVLEMVIDPFGLIVLLAAATCLRTSRQSMRKGSKGAALLSGVVGYLLILVVFTYFWLYVGHPAQAPDPYRR